MLTSLTQTSQKKGGGGMSENSNEVDLWKLTENFEHKEHEKKYKCTWQETVRDIWGKQK